MLDLNDKIQLRKNFGIHSGKHFNLVPQTDAAEENLVIEE